MAVVRASRPVAARPNSGRCPCVQSGWIRPSSVELVEAHGTSTKVGDATELSTLGRLWTDIEAGDNVLWLHQEPNWTPQGRRWMAGFQGPMALHHATIRPVLVEPPAQRWIGPPIHSCPHTADGMATARRPSTSRRGAFGFGGTNFHVALEAYDPEVHTGMADGEPAERVRQCAGCTSGPRSYSTATPSLDHAALKSVEGGLLLLSVRALRPFRPASQRLLLTVRPSTMTPVGIGFQPSSRSGPQISMRMQRCGLRSWPRLGPSLRRQGLAVSSLSDPRPLGFPCSAGRHDGGSACSLRPRWRTCTRVKAASMLG